MEGESGRLLELPVDTLVDILLRVPAKSVGCIKCVSKTLLKTVSDVSFSTLHTRLWAAAADQVPRLMFCSRHENLLSLQSVKYKDNALTKGRYTINVSSPTDTEANVRFVFHNIVCLVFSGEGDSMLVNSLGERGVLRLPECIFARQERFSRVNPRCWFGMAFDDRTSTYKVLCVTSEKDYQIRHGAMRVHVLVLGTNSWRQISSLPPPEFSWIPIVDKPTCTNGAVHWLTGTECDRIVSFDFRREEFCWTPSPPALQQSSKEDWMESRMCLFTLKGCLAILRTKSFWSFSSGKIRNIEIWVLKDFNQEERLGDVLQ
ncbi:F-box protein At5g65850-like [Argentina anserina]|uniref:F-box protein At5g65850-like n=1 Tax=Argentina anserina TaxID=57926 RepID=UPI0021765E38|nr:F-box protein At5g65850-like [Potentilla anserina]